MYSIVIPSLGRIHYLIELLDSIKNQTIQPSEILILLDDNNHCKKLSKVLVRYKHVKLIFCKKMNLAQKRNYGASIASKDILLFSDDDDIWKTQRAVSTLKALVKYDVCCHNFDQFGYVNRRNVSRLGSQDIILSFPKLLKATNIFGGGSSMACKKFIVNIFPFSEKLAYGEDFDWWIMLILPKVKILYIGKSLVSYRSHASNMTKRKAMLFLFSLKISLNLLKSSCSHALIALLIFLRSFFVFSFKLFL